MFKIVDMRALLTILFIYAVSAVAQTQNPDTANADPAPQASPSTPAPAPQNPEPEAAPSTLTSQPPVEQPPQQTPATEPPPQTESAPAAMPNEPAKPEITTVTVTEPSKPSSNFEFAVSNLKRIEKKDRASELVRFCEAIHVKNCSSVDIVPRGINLTDPIKALFGSDHNDKAQIVYFVFPRPITRKESIDFLKSNTAGMPVIGGPPPSLFRSRSLKVKRTSAMIMDYEWVGDLAGNRKTRIFVLRNAVSGRSVLVVADGATDKDIVSSPVFQAMYRNFDLHK